MKGKIILGLGTIGVTISSLSIVACSNKNKQKADKEDVSITKSDKEMNKYPKLTEEFRNSNIVTEFVRKKGVSYFSKYENHVPKHPSLHSTLDISLDGLWFTSGGWGKEHTINGSGVIVINYHEIYDYAHSKTPNLYPYLNNN